MKHDFGEQTMEEHSRRLSQDDLWLTRWVWYQRTGKPPLTFDEFTPQEIIPFLVGIEKALESPTSQKWGAPKALKLPENWDEPVVTGEPLIDKWEREIAEGLSPNLKEGI